MLEAIRVRVRRMLMLEAARGAGMYGMPRLLRVFWPDECFLGHTRYLLGSGLGLELGLGLAVCTCAHACIGVSVRGRGGMQIAYEVGHTGLSRPAGCVPILTLPPTLPLPLPLEEKCVLRDMIDRWA